MHSYRTTIISSLWTPVRRAILSTVKHTVRRSVDDTDVSTHWASFWTTNRSTEQFPDDFDKRLTNELTISVFEWATAYQCTKFCPVSCSLTSSKQCAHCLANEFAVINSKWASNC